MASKGQKLARKRANAGRPRVKDVDRYPGGQIKHKERERGIMEAVIEARDRHHDINVRKLMRNDIKAGHDPQKTAKYSGYLLGRLYLRGLITEAQLDAGDRFAEDTMRYCQMTGIPYPSARAQDINRVAGTSGDEPGDTRERVERASNRMMKMIGKLLSCPSGPQVKMTVVNVAVMDYANLIDMPPKQLEWLRVGLNALAASQ